MKFILVSALLLSGCSLSLGYPCGMVCEEGMCRCEPISNPPRGVFWVKTHTPATVKFYRCDCAPTPTRIVHTDGSPIPSDDSLGECRAVVVGSWNPPYDCEMSPHRDTGYVACYHDSDYGGSFACGDNF